jgi:hypothetical protein
LKTLETSVRSFHLRKSHFRSNELIDGLCEGFAGPKAVAAVLAHRRLFEVQERVADRLFLNSRHSVAPKIFSEDQNWFSLRCFGARLRVRETMFIVQKRVEVLRVKDCRVLRARLVETCLGFFRSSKKTSEFWKATFNTGF